MTQAVANPADRLRVRRHPERGHYDGPTVEAILKEGLICHVAIVHEGAPVVLPMAYGLWQGGLVLHGSPASRLLRAMAGGAEMSIAVTLLDGLVLARSTLHHSMNYRSVVIHGRGREIVDEKEKAAALEAVVEHLIPGRSQEARPADRQEVAATLVVVVPLDEAAAKIRSGPPKDAARDLDLGVWAGVLPLALTAGTPQADEGTAARSMPLAPSAAAQVTRRAHHLDAAGATG
jgi:nitroimidazol reductase NimA-like FMN-containing flavoprotein (pyridoxamine 5'-phosphate oxidase superfamily)